jgi:hypothetical protein
MRVRGVCIGGEREGGVFGVKCENGEERVKMLRKVKEV